MGWERRGNRMYYYAAHREGGTVVKHLVPACLVPLVERAAAERRAERAAAADDRRQALADLDALAAALAPLHELADAAAAAAMLAAGYHRHHRGTWRKRRGRAEAYPGHDRISQAEPGPTG